MTLQQHITAAVAEHGADVVYPILRKALVELKQQMLLERVRQA